MPKFIIGNHTVRRKNLYLPCLIAENIDKLSVEDKVKAYRKTWWLDNITRSEWEALLSGDRRLVAKRKPRLKRKAVGWFMALARIAVFQPNLYNEVVAEAESLYMQQFGEPHPLFKQSEIQVDG